MSVLPSLESVQFLLGATVYAYEDGRVDIVSWGEHGGIGLVGYGGLRRLGEGGREADLSPALLAGTPVGGRRVRRL